MELLVALEGESAVRMPLGTRNQRILELHRHCVGSPLEAVVTCPRCGEESEFPVPSSDICALESIPVDAQVVVRIGGADVAFRVPNLEDISATAGLPYATAIRALAERTNLLDAPGQGSTHDPIEVLTDDDLDRLASAWEAEDPAGAITVDLSCAACGLLISSRVDPAEFVARDLDREAGALLTQVHVIASAYGWTEGIILRLSAERRQQYVEMIGAPASAAGGLSLAAP
jgi:hypothetical protein